MRTLHTSARPVSRQGTIVFDPRVPATPRVPLRCVRYYDAKIRFRSTKTLCRAGSGVAHSGGLCTLANTVLAARAKYAAWIPYPCVLATICTFSTELPICVCETSRPYNIARHQRTHRCASLECIDAEYAPAYQASPNIDLVAGSASSTSRRTAFLGVMMLMLGDRSRGKRCPSTSSTPHTHATLKAYKPRELSCSAKLKLYRFSIFRRLLKLPHFRVEFF